ncbi:hypothetical protein SAMN05421747_10893 [Parapedobacter composti]|uniref:WH2 domain-containing protein n=1 Tax=Parapedobacter composti TaxID=623281 RepID=A0A1I1I6J7_9SPHI|nr:glycosyltransferase family 2 protein [Parapedobacter composti]SFC31756.1 hypothetical protein SAMN05421747_10893 [Parapedobacter composti]
MKAALTPKIGLVTVLYRSEAVLPGFFRSLSAQSFKDYHLYLIDNEPSRNSAALIQAMQVQYPVAGYTYIANDENKGVAHGNNQGIEHSLNAGCTHTLLLNNDIEFEQEHLLRDMYAHAVISGDRMVVPKILFYDSRKIWMAGGRLLKFRGYTTHVGGLKPDGPDYDVAGYFDYAPTCFMLIDNRLFEEIGLMDPNYFVYFDDTDFVYRAVKRRYRVYYLPQLVVLHKESSSTGGAISPFFTYYFNRNRIYFIRKNFRGLQRWIALSVTTLANLRNLIRYGRQSRRNLLNAIKAGWQLKPVHHSDR